jgi:hypothetical protein
VLVVAGSLLLGTLSYDTSLVLVGLYMAVLGAGLGMLMQNLVLVVQNSIELKNLGVATSAITFFRSLGGTVGVSVLGSVLGTIIAQQIADGIPKLSPADQLTAVQTLGSGTIPHVASLPAAIRTLVESAYGSGVGDVFFYSVPLALVALVAVVFLPNAKLGSENAVQLKSKAGRLATGSPRTGAIAVDRQREVENAEDGLIDVAAAASGLTPVGLAHPTGSIDVVSPTVETSRARH